MLSPPKVNEVVACTCCRATDLATLFQATDYISKDCFEIVQCQRCGLVMTSPVPDREAMSRYYPDSYFGASGQRFAGFGEAIIRLERERRARAIQRFCPQPGRVLDIGCGRGVMLHKLKRKGWECYGSELSEALTQQLKVAGIQTFRELDVRNCHFPNSFFDVVSLWHSLEHLPAPCPTLDEIYRILKPNGIVVFAVPNLGGWLSQWTRQNWFGLDVPRHLFHYDRQSLPSLIESHKLSIERISDFSIEQDVLGAAQSLLNLLGFRHNAFYNLIRNRTARPAESERLPFGETAMLAVVGGMFLALSFPLCLAASLAHSGGTLEIWSRKRSGDSNEV
jgi:SAM-dependent methyltransferase